jgi:hypothetical protein
MGQFFDFDMISYTHSSEIISGPAQLPLDADQLQKFDDASTGTFRPPDIISLNFQAKATLTTTLPTFASLPTITQSSRPRYQCNTCDKSYAHMSDRARHAAKRNPNAHRHACPEPTCKFSGMNGMVRKDKMREHRARHGH